MDEYIDESESEEMISRLCFIYASNDKLLRVVYYVIMPGNNLDSRTPSRGCAVQLEDARAILRLGVRKRYRGLGITFEV